MKELLRTLAHGASWACLLLLLSTPVRGRASVVTFDNGNLGPFTYTNFAVQTDPCSSSLRNTGFCLGVVSAPSVGGNSNPTLPFTMTYTGPGTFSFDSVYVGSPFSTSATTSVTIDGYFQGVKEDTRKLAVPGNGPSVLFSANWTGLDELVFSPNCVGVECSGQEGVVVDNLVYDAATPEPGQRSFLLVGTLFAALGILARRRIVTAAGPHRSPVYWGDHGRANRRDQRQTKNSV